MIYSTEVWEDFEKKIQEIGVHEDLRSLTSLDFNFFERYMNYTVVNVREFSSNPNNLMVLTEKDSYLFSNQKISEDSFKLFKYTLKKDFGESTVLALIVLKKVLASHSAEFEKLNTEIDRQEEVLDPVAVERLGRHLRKIHDAADDFLDVLIKLEDREVREVNTSYVSYDYDVLLGKTRHLIDRIKSHLDQITWLRNEIELKYSRELNKRIENLNVILKKLTALTIILMLPQVLAGHFGMNFKYMPFLDWQYGELATAIVSFGAMGLAAIYFYRKGWL